MEKVLVIMYLIGFFITLPHTVLSRLCQNGIQCSDAQECCIIGCCPSSPPTGQKNLVFNHYDKISAPMKYYLWSLVCVTGVVLMLAWCCKLRQNIRWRRLCHFCTCSHTPRNSEPDSTGSCYYPPQYSRCGSLCRASLQPAPPPYNEVTSKPDLYPMVIYLGPDKNDGDFMMHYYKNYIVRPNGSISATSTTDSLNSSFLCHATNEANTVIPPPYSCSGNTEWTQSASPRRQTILRSISSVICHHHHHQQQTSSGNSQLANYTQNDNNRISSANNPEPKYSIIKKISHSSSVPMKNSDGENNNGSNMHAENSSTDYRATACGSKDSRQLRVQINRYCANSSSESLDNNFDHNGDFYRNISCSDNDINCHANMKENHLDHKDCRTHHDCNMKGNSFKSDNFTECNCTKSKIEDSSNYNINSIEDNQCRCCCNSTIEERIIKNVSSDYSIFTKKINNFDSKDEIHIFSVGNSMTASDISSLANLGTPDSPPRATSPTSELREILDKIQQLPIDDSSAIYTENDNNDEPIQSIELKGKRHFYKNRKSNLYMPLSTSKTTVPGKVSPQSSGSLKAYFAKKSWLSRSAPTTPSGIVPNLLTVSNRNNLSGSGKLSQTNKQNKADSNPLLAEQELSGEEGDE